MPPFIDKSGQRFGRLTVLREWERRPTGKSTAIFWNCRCDCGREVFINSGHLSSGNSTTCGCWRKGRPSNQRTHGMTGSPEYRSWQAMKRRCYYPKDILFHRWGGRGIRVCDHWIHSFENFLEDMGMRPSLQHSLDRLDNDSDYGPQNCRWATRSQQCRNTPRNRLLTLDGATFCLAEWAERTGIASNTIRRRIDHARWSVEKALTTPVHHKPS